jgi:hypothetical protein
VFGETKMSEASDISDGYHTFGELYEHRHALFLAVCRAYNGWKSLFHDDGTTMNGWFIAGVETPGGMATYHLPLSWWSRYNVRELECAPKWDGHSSQDVIERLQTLHPARAR